MPVSPDAREAVQRYHDDTKHAFHRFARSVGYLDWASQPRPFREFIGARSFPLFPSPAAPRQAYQPAGVSYDRLFDVRSGARSPDAGAGNVSSDAIGDVLRHALGLTAWKQFRESRWSLRANPSSGNLHPTEAYVVCGSLAGLSETPGVYHYAPERHVLELRCSLDVRAWSSACDGHDHIVLAALTSIHWREAWKYGERAFRYCQHDLGHAVAALSLAAAMVGWRVSMRPGWSHREIAALTGIDRDEDYREAEREEPGCLLVLSPDDAHDVLLDGSGPIAPAIAGGSWYGRASQLSENHVQWTFIDEVSRATEWAGGAGGAGGERSRPHRAEAPEHRGEVLAPLEEGGLRDRAIDARRLMRQRRSAVAFDGRSTIDRPTFLTMLTRVMPASSAPWDALWWPPAIHLALFIHRVEDVAPGLYLLARTEPAIEVIRRAMDREFLWEREAGDLPLVCLARGDGTRLSARLSCDQDIAADGYFSFGMMADFDAGLDANGPAFYRHLFWESGVVGQVMYLEAEAAGARATGIGCFYDDPVHEAFGFRGHAFQSLYHFTVGTPVEDARLTSAPGYQWERG